MQHWTDAVTETLITKEALEARVRELGEQITRDYQGKKLIGSAQCRKNGYILQHGSILYDYDKELLEKIFKEPADDTSITSIKAIRPDLSRKDIISVFENVDNFIA